MNNVTEILYLLPPFQLCLKNRPQSPIFVIYPPLLLSFMDTPFGKVLQTSVYTWQL